ncbi:MAG TPA: hypothetical protein DCX25_02290 [Candidatus Pacebacteria bacterium]|nr:MAG: hypothetical protein UX36_C0001G0153 [Microgenomates group bacterium GW2011_GWC1_46_15]HAV15132.1 hypothetical protein [Candidatus Paceibacterota bacterium]HCR11040.1 hypothetical protein [Candidatus Paceibacterota bacterium]HCR92645.1 hypothetical protein [Candidatus Paceibacterota bacterium]
MIIDPQNIQYVLDRFITTLLSQHALSWKNAYAWKLNETPHARNTLPVIFPAFMFLHCTQLIKDNPQLDNMRGKICSWLMRHQTQETKTWNWWQRNAKERETRPYPDDLDDTACALAAIHAVNPQYITGEMLAKFTSALCQSEQQPGGPYRTWLVSAKDKKWHDVDPVVNCNIAYALSLFGVTLDQQIKYLAQRFQMSCASPYYPSSLPCAYFFARMFHSAQPSTQEKLESARKYVEFIVLELLKNNQNTPHTIALGTTTLLYLHSKTEKIEKGITSLCSAYPKLGMGELCIYTNFHGDCRVAGSPPTTLALCIETLSVWIAMQKKKDVTQNAKIKEEVFAFTQKRITGLPFLLRKKVKKVLHDFSLDKNAAQATGLPFLTFSTLTQENSIKISHRTLVELGCANVCGWISYTLLDARIDKQKQAEKFLPLAPFFYREALRIYAKFCPTNHPFWKTCHKILATVDDAYVKEALHITSPLMHSGKKSLGHALCAVAALFLSHQDSHQRIAGIQKFFLLYLTAKQLNDDLHDWEQDYTEGRITPVVSLVLKYSASRNIKKLRTAFWECVLPESCRILVRCFAHAEHVLLQAKLPNPQPFLLLLGQAENDFHKAEHEIRTIHEFIFAPSKK